MEAQLKDLIGKTMVSVDNNNNDEIIFKTDDGKQYKLFHEQDCCENVNVEDVNGNLEDLIGSPILMAEEATSNENPESITKEYQNDSYTWTFYKFATMKGYVTIRWYGESSGYYSEKVDFCEC